MNPNVMRWVLLSSRSRAGGASIGGTSAASIGGTAGIGGVGGRGTGSLGSTAGECTAGDVVLSIGRRAAGTAVVTLLSFGR